MLFGFLVGVARSPFRLFVGEGAAFEVAGEGVFGVLALGGLPFLAAWTYLDRRHRAALDWSATAP
ncbi:hypothetical protein [Streptomyces sp. CMB-StM0423]|uniref:hypothetical protein n=1 Tax=Streptomyces sp. CMB-StM0423 TaxID=2059884 RepID=UPI0018FE98DB|nr:hypothetical protein [Streptomyces sp. CMB-StM0423]